MTQEIKESKFTLEDVLKCFIDGVPVGRTVYNHPWFEFAKKDGLTLFIAPKRVMERPSPLYPYVETDGLQYEWRGSDGKVIGNGWQCGFEYFLKTVLPKEVPDRSYLILGDEK